MRVVPDHHVRARIDDRPGERLLARKRSRVVLGAPMRVDDDDLCAGSAGRGDVGAHGGDGELGAARRARPGRVVLRDRVVGKDGHRHSTHAHVRGFVGSGCGRAGSAVLQPESVQV